MTDLQKKLILVEKVNVSGYGTMHNIALSIWNKESIILEILNDNTYSARYHALTIEQLSENNPDNRVWSTYEECAQARFYIEEAIKDNTLKCDRLVAKVDVFNGDGCYGYRTDLRFSVLVELPMTYLEMIESSIERAFSEYMEERYSDYLEEKKVAWIKKTSAILLKERD